MVNKEKYLARIKYSGNLEPTFQVLGRLQEAHLLNVPFENLDIFYGVPIVLDIDKIYRKVILNHRGGFCYELNGLFYELLVSLGFRARRVSARVFDKSNGYGPEFDHMAIITEIDGSSYLTDVGFGEFSFSPLMLDTEVVQIDARGKFSIQRYEGDNFLVSKWENKILIPQYIFSTIARELDEYSEMCHFHQTSPASHFTRNALITRPTQGGRITLTQDTLKIKHGDSINEVQIENAEAFRNLLWKYFSIGLNADRKFV